MTIRFAAPSVLPGTDYRRATGLLESELRPQDLSTLVELPSRGHHATQLGRASAQLSQLYTELTSYGWRLVDRPGADYTRASTVLTADVDTLADVRGAQAETDDDAANHLQIQLLGPVSMAAQLHLPGGEKVLIDHGARRDLADSLAEGLTAHIQHVRRAVPAETIQVVVLEPDYARARSGRVPTVSGYRTIRALDRDEARPLVGVVVEALRGAGADEVLLDFGAAPQAEHLDDFRTAASAAVDGFGIPLHRSQWADWERAATLVESGGSILAGLLDPEEVGRSPAALPEVSQLADRLKGPWHRLGMSEKSLAAFTITGSTAGQRHRWAEFSESAAMRTLTRLRDTAAALTDQIQQ